MHSILWNWLSYYCFSNFNVRVCAFVRTIESLTLLPLSYSGQTGSGKTFTMLDARHGLYVLAARDIFTMLNQPRYSHLSAWIGFYELYQGQLYDLLNDRKRLFAREDGKQNVVIAGLKEYPINDVNNLMQIFEYGSSIRSTGKYYILIILWKSFRKLLKSAVIRLL